MHCSAFNARIMKAGTTIKIDERRDKPWTMSGKIEAVRENLGQYTGQVMAGAVSG